MSEQEKANGQSAEQKLDEADRLRIENIYLKLMHLQSQVQILDLQKASVAGQMKELQAQMEKERQALSVKYGLDINPTTVKPDGTIKGAMKPVPVTADPQTVRAEEESKS